MADNWRDTSLSGVGPGWEPLVDELDSAVLALAPERVVEQVKEKFGGLRYYVSLGSVDGATADQAWELISEAEERSFTICEDCGTTEGVTTEGPGWIKTLCPACREAARARRKAWLSGS